MSTFLRITVEPIVDGWSLVGMARVYPIVGLHGTTYFLLWQLTDTRFMVFKTGGIARMSIQWWVSQSCSKFVSVQLASCSALVSAPAVAGYVARCFGTYVAEPKEAPGENLSGLL